MNKYRLIEILFFIVLIILYYRKILNFNNVLISISIYALVLRILEIVGTEKKKEMFYEHFQAPTTSTSTSTSNTQNNPFTRAKMIRDYNENMKDTLLSPMKLYFSVFSKDSWRKDADKWYDLAGNKSLDNESLNNNNAGDPLYLL